VFYIQQYFFIWLVKLQKGKKIKAGSELNQINESLEKIKNLGDRYPKQLQSKIGK